MDKQSREIYNALAKAVLLLAGVVVLLWFFYQFVGILLLFFFTLVIAIILNAPATWLELKGVPRWLSALIVCFGTLGILGLLGWLVVPKLVNQVSDLIADLPHYTKQLSNYISALFDGYPKIQEKLALDSERVAQNLPSLPSLLGGIWSFSLSFFEVIVFVIIVFSMVLYTVLNPRPLLALYLEVFPPAQREKATNAFARMSDMIISFIWTNLLIGAMEAVIATIFLSFIGLPGALVWGSFALFAELVPRVGPYLMATPPILIALSVSPTTALWVIIFYIALNEIMDNLVMPRLLASSMDIHPVSILFLMIALGSGFGLLGAFIATPFAAFIKAFYEEFYLSRYSKDENIDGYIKRMLHRKFKSEENQSDEKTD